MSSLIVIADYDPNWPIQFKQLKAPIAEAMGDLAVAIEHVGSTSVPGLAAKPIIDLDVAVPDELDVPEGIRRLAAIGYVHRGDLGIKGREAFDTPPTTIRHHPYLVAVNGREFKRHITFRDRLRADAELRQKYEALKRRLAVEYKDNVDGYSEAKSVIIRPVLEEALGSDH